MDDSIELSPEHGVNPSLVKCFWCGEETGEIALLGRIKNEHCDDIEAPRHMVISYDPCEKCAETFSKGILLVEISDSPNSDGQPPIREGCYPTGTHMVLTETGARRILSEDIIDSVIDTGRALIDQEAFSMIASLVPAE